MIYTELVSSLRVRLNVLNKNQILVKMYAEKFGKDERVECTSSSFFKAVA